MRSKTIEESVIWKLESPGRHTFIEYQPGNGSRYVVSTQQLPAAVCERLGCQRGSFLITLPDGAGCGKCMLLAPGGYLDPSYVAEKLGLKNLDDIMVLTELFGHLLSRKTPEALDGEDFCGRTHNE